MDWQDMLFQNWSGIVRTIIVGSLAYATLVFFLHISGKRTLAKLNAFDLVVTVAPWLDAVSNHPPGEHCFGRRSDRPCAFDPLAVFGDLPVSPLNMFCEGISLRAITPPKRGALQASDATRADHEWRD